MHPQIDSDRYLAFADILHDVVGQNHLEKHRAFLRIEDISPVTPPATIRAIADYLKSQNVPFALAVIPQYWDPYGANNNGVPEYYMMKDAPALVSALKYAVSKGGKILQHGYTHQYNNVANPYNGCTGDDFEFYRLYLDANGNQVLAGPVPEDSQSWAEQRVYSGSQELQALGLYPAAWETPHYLASVQDYKVFRAYYKSSADRTISFTKLSDGSLQCLQQMAPYPLLDEYNILRIPETIGYLDPYGYSSAAPVMPLDLCNRASATKVVRDGWAGCYFHWFLDIAYLKEMVSGMKARGLTFSTAPTKVDF